MTIQKLIKKYKQYVNAGYGIVQIREMIIENEPNLPDIAVDNMLAELFKSNGTKKKS